MCQEVAQNFKEHGNEFFKNKRYRDALGFYTQGVDAKPTDVALEEALLCNRAACNLELSTINDYPSRYQLTGRFINRELRLCPGRLLQGINAEFSVVESILSLWPGLDGSGQT